MSSHLINIIVLFIGNFCRNSGVHKIQLNDANLVDKMSNAECEQKFVIESFVLSPIKRKIAICSNGDDAELKGYFILRLNMDLPKYIDTITVGECFV